ncbi:MAG TPA: IS21 family transposase [Vicinamibacterales bacterium]|jgi:transposase
MATERLPMRHIREILRLKWTLKRSHRETARSLGISPGAVASVVSRATQIGLTWDALAQVTDDALEERLYGPKITGRVARPLPDPAWIHTELRRAGVTLELLHLEYLQQQPNGYRYSAFCAQYRTWLDRQRISMRQVHAAGEKLFVDYSGKKPEVVDQATGTVRAVDLFVAVLGASNYTYAEASETQRSADFIQSHTHAVEFLTGVPALIVPDQLKTGVRDACRYEPILQRTYAEWAAHYQTAILPARPAKPRDKAKAEVGVQVAQRWILARLRHETFFSLAALNARIRELLIDLNARPMKGYGGLSRRDLFERFDRPALRPLPGERFVYTEWRQVRVNIDYHVEVDHHLYSVPYRLIHQTLDVRLSATTVEVFQRGTRVWVHRRSHQAGGFTTIPEHMPHAHRAHLEWSPSRLIRWGTTVGPQTTALVEQILASRPHPEQGYRSCLGLLRLAKQYGAERVEAASARAVLVGARSYRHVEAMLKHGLDRVPLDTDDSIPAPRPTHANVRGPVYYQQELPHAD